MEPENRENLNAIETFRMKKLFKRLESAKISGSVVTIVIPPKKQISQITNMLLAESGKASNIKDRTNRNSVIDAQTSARERLKLYNRTPDNGLILFCGYIMEENGTTEKKIMIDFEPFRPVNLSIYDCDSKFKLEDIKKELLMNEPPFGFIIVDGCGALYATLQGNAKEIISKFTVELPKKHGRGGQSSVRFARLRQEKRHNYLRKVCQVATNCFISDNKCNVQGLILAGSADFKNVLAETNMFDQRLAAKVITTLDVCYGFENGLNQAIELAQESLQNVKFVKEKEVISNFFEEINMDTGMVVYGIKDTMKLLKAGSIKKIICNEALEHLRIPVRNKETQQESELYLLPNELNDKKKFMAGEQELERTDSQNELLSEWLSVNYGKFGAELEFVTDKSPEGTQFLKGFSGLGGFLHYKLQVEHMLGEAEEWTGEDEDFI